jgi:acetyltransferase-like isoleucine patch superfamily enzyme
MVHTKIAAFIRRLWNWAEKRKHTPRTMAVYLRRLGAQVGEDCFIVPTDLDRQIDPRMLRIGNHVAIAAGVSFSQDGSRWLTDGEPPGPNLDRPVLIHDNCFIGYRAIIGPGVSIGPNSVIGAGSVVLSDVAANTLAMGAPARPFGSMERYREKCVERWGRQRPPEAIVEPGHTWWSTAHMSRNRGLLKARLLAIFADRLGATAHSDRSTR